MKLKILVALSSIFLSGCASLSGGPQPLTVANVEINAIKPVFDSTQIFNYFNSNDSNTRTILRNNIVSARLYALDLRFSEYTQQLAKELRGGAFSLDLVSSLLSATATVINPGRSTQVLTGVDTLVKNGRSSFSKEILIDRTLPVLINQMKASRKIIATEIWSNLKNFSDQEYPLPLALSQLEEYYQAGTISGALAGIGKSTSSSLEKASKDFNKEVLTINFGNNDHKDILNKYLDSSSNEEEREVKLRKIQEIIEESGETIVVTELIASAGNQYDELRKIIIEVLKIGDSSNATDS